MSSFKEKVMSFLKEKKLESEFIMFLSEYDDSKEGGGLEKMDKNDKGTAKYMGEKHSLKRLLNTVGKRTFVEYYNDFNSNSYLKNITKDGKVSIGSAKAKRSSANAIFKLGLEKKALEFIANSNRVEPWVSLEAEKIINDNEFSQDDEFIDDEFTKDDEFNINSYELSSKSMNTKYSYEKVIYVVEMAYKEYKKIENLNLRSKFPMKYKKMIFRSFQEKFGTDHSFYSVTMLIDNILANWNIKGYLKFNKGSKMVQKAAVFIWNENN